MTETGLLEIITEYGWQGFCGVLICIIVWLMRQLLCVLKENSQIIAANTQAIRESHRVAIDSMNLLRGINDKLLQRPCLREAT